MNQKSTSRKNFKVSFRSVSKKGLRAKFVVAAENLGKKAAEHHFSMGRSVTVGRNGEVIVLYPSTNK